jgi:hypothetical protein
MPNVELAAPRGRGRFALGALHRRSSEAGEESRPMFRDIRKVLDDKNIDAVSIATPNHWHTLQTIWACQAGKDVYVEKPCSHNVFESKQIVAAARKYGRIVQMGSQSRSSPALQEAVQKMKAANSATSTWPAASASRPATPSARPRSSLFPRRRLRHVDRAGSHASVHQEPLPLQLALVLGYRQRRPRQPGHPRGGYRPLGPGRHAPHQGERHRRQVHVRRRPGDAEHDERVLRVQRRRQAEDDDFEVRHWYSNHEAGIGGNRPGNTIGNTFYGSTGYLVIDGYNKYYSFMGKDQKPGPPGPSATSTENFMRRCAAASGKT